MSDIQKPEHPHTSRWLERIDLAKQCSQALTPAMRATVWLLVVLTVVTCCGAVLALALHVDDMFASLVELARAVIVEPIRELAGNAHDETVASLHPERFPGTDRSEHIVSAIGSSALLCGYLAAIGPAPYLGYAYLRAKFVDR